MSLNFANFRVNAPTQSWLDIYDNSIPFGCNLLSFINRFIILPDSIIQSKIIAAYAVQNSALLNKCYHLYIYGDTGSGKSLISKLISTFASKGEIKSSASTIKSIRNYIAENQYEMKGGVILKDRNDQPIEKPIFLIWDDLDESILKQDYFYQMFKTGTDRKTANIMISDARTGVNIEFNTFCPKILTSCFIPFKFPKYAELSRRCLFIKCQTPDIDISHLEDIDNYSWEGLHAYYAMSWQNEEKIAEFYRIFNALRKSPRITLHQWEASKSLIATGVVQGIYVNIQEGIQNLVDYWQLVNNEIYKYRSDTEKLLELAIEQWEQSQPDKLKRYIYCNYIDTFLKERIKNGEISDCARFSAKKRSDAMEALGYKLELFYGKNFWVKQ